MGETGDSSTPKGLSDDKKKEKAEEKQPKMEENVILTEAQPLAWRPPDEYYRQLLTPAFKDGQLLGLPPGWQVEQRPRTSPKYIGKVDQFYYEPGTRRQFRSLKAVMRHLQATGQLPPAAGEEQANRQQNVNTADQPEKQEGDRPEGSQRSGKRPWKKLARKRKQSPSFEFDFANPPKKVTWARTDAENDQWNPMVGETMVSEAVKDLWAETFVSLIKQKNKAPKL